MNRRRFLAFASAACASFSSITGFLKQTVAAAPLAAAPLAISTKLNYATPLNFITFNDIKNMWLAIIDGNGVMKFTDANIDNAKKLIDCIETVFGWKGLIKHINVTDQEWKNTGKYYNKILFYINDNPASHISENTWHINIDKSDANSVKFVEYIEQYLNERNLDVKYTMGVDPVSDLNITRDPPGVLEINNGRLNTAFWG